MNALNEHHLGVVVEETNIGEVEIERLNPFRIVFVGILWALTFLGNQLCTVDVLKVSFLIDRTTLFINFYV